MTQSKWIDPVCLSFFTCKMRWRRKWQTTPISLPRKPQMGSLRVGYHWKNWTTTMTKVLSSTLGKILSEVFFALFCNFFPFTISLPQPPSQCSHSLPSSKSSAFSPLSPGLPSERKKNLSSLWWLTGGDIFTIRTPEWRKDFWTKAPYETQHIQAHLWHLKVLSSTHGKEGGKVCLESNYRWG